MTAPSLGAGSAVDVEELARELAEEFAEALLLAMDGDFLPAAGMGVDNQGADVALNVARPKEVAWWAADILAAHVARAPTADRERVARLERVEALVERWQRCHFDQHSARSMRTALVNALAAPHVEPSP